jgi:hypothetical protein
MGLGVKPCPALSRCSQAYIGIIYLALNELQVRAHGQDAENQGQNLLTVNGLYADNRACPTHPCEQGQCLLGTKLPCRCIGHIFWLFRGDVLARNQ